MLPRNRFFLIHGVIVAAWFVVLIAQSSLITAGRVDLHRRLGSLSMGLAAAVVVFGVAAAVIAARRPTGYIDVAMPPKMFLAIPLLGLLQYAVFVVLAYLKRGNAQAHKRLMLLASLSIIGAGDHSLAVRYDRCALTPAGIRVLRPPGIELSPAYRRVGPDDAQTHPPRDAVRWTGADCDGADHRPDIAVRRMARLRKLDRRRLNLSWPGPRLQLRAASQQIHHDQDGNRHPKHPQQDVSDLAALGFQCISVTLNHGACGSLCSDWSFEWSTQRQRVRVSLHLEVTSARKLVGDVRL
jgi:hypothetical protein